MQFSLDGQLGWTEQQERKIFCTPVSVRTKSPTKNPYASASSVLQPVGQLMRLAHLRACLRFTRRIPESNKD